ncbi:hypothetical protein PV735_38770 [Streptomyces turgidiscabies]|uniref:hypothetical protein n=1 Tax=Streptomyces TaxID=1883 RepID=UPI00117DAA3C|nr:MULTISPECIES: hypothetical protein [Streptomyces]MDX3498593.1 hypothetical protein [Streptomyces turgidiscabies]
MSNTFTQSVRLFLDAAEWLDQEADAPAITALEKLAEALDKNVTASLAAEFNKTFRYLRTSKPVTEDDLDDEDLAPRE